MVSLNLIAILALLPCFLCQDFQNDPLCSSKVCPTGQICRHYKPCGERDSCNVTTICTSTQVTRGGCLHGDPVLYSNNGNQEDLACYNEAPCPSNGYCSTLLQDISSVCCLSSPVVVVREGVCPSFEPDPSRFWCVDECKNDADCHHDSKCCHTGCSMECIYVDPVTPPAPIDLIPPTLAPEYPSPAKRDPCDGKVCPTGQSCRHYKPCGQKENCDVTAICTATQATRGGCKFGDPVLFSNNGKEEDLTCYPAAPCPSNAYCSTLLQDTSAVCCLSDPALTMRDDLICPVPIADPDRFWCVDGCQADGDCYSSERCCHTGCSKECIPAGTPPPPPIGTPPAPMTPSNDPCVGMSCPSGQTCRHFKPCGLKETCNVIGTCTDVTSNQYGCMHGSPVLFNDKGKTSMLSCWRDAPCPSNAYCSTVLMDTSSRCCLADPAKTVKAGTCPAPGGYNTNPIFCYDECKHDGDCDWDSKCCNTGCKLECIPPKPTEIPQLPPTTIPQTRDPCSNKVCPSGQVCRHFKPCGLKENCNVTATCTDVTSGQGGCMHGSPVLFNDKGKTSMLSCWRDAPCPSNAYCSTVLMDTSSRCCLADPAKTVKAGTCPAPGGYNTNPIFCYDECKHDGDCDWDSKCCNTGCKLECIPPKPTEIPQLPPTTIPQTRDPCSNKVCPSGQVCRHFKPCGLKENCNVTATCTDVTSGQGGCMHGSPVLFNDMGKTSMLSCWGDAPCPSNAYCSTVLMDTSSRCCLADPAMTVKPGTCPAPGGYNTNPIFCYDECKHDGDCDWDSKCCNTGCKLECIPPKPTEMPQLPPTTIPQTRDPCSNKVCPSGQVCRHFKPCGLKENCNVTATCTDMTYDQGGCMHGSPVLFNDKGKTSMLSCWGDAPCPSNAYCSTVLMDTSSRCCLADPAMSVKAGSCPVNNPYGTNPIFCYDECKHDGDCDWDSKCCNTGCKLECVPPKAVTVAPPTTPKPRDPCDNKLCPAHMYCRRRGAPCRNQWYCRPEGSCIRCPFLPFLGLPGDRIGVDPDGCTAVIRQTPPFAPGFGKPRLQIDPLTFLLYNHLNNKK